MGGDHARPWASASPSDPLTATACLPGFAELQTDMTDLTKELNRSQGIPFLEYKHFVTRTFFPKVSSGPCRLLQELLDPSLGPENLEGTSVLMEELDKCSLGPLSSTKPARLPVAAWAPALACRGRGPSFPHFPSLPTDVLIVHTEAGCQAHFSPGVLGMTPLSGGE